MPQTSVIQETQSQSTCETCPKFKDFNDRGRGLCQVFDKIVRKHHTLTNDCVQQIESEQLQELLSTHKAFTKPISKMLPGVNVFKQLPELGYERIGYVSENLEGWFALNQHGLTIVDRLPSQNEAIQKLLDSFQSKKSKDDGSPLEPESTLDFQSFEPEEDLPHAEYQPGQIVKVIDEGEEDCNEWASFVVIGASFNQNRFRSTQAYLSEPDWNYLIASVARPTQHQFWVAENEICHVDQSHLIETAEVF